MFCQNYLIGLTGMLSDPDDYRIGILIIRGRLDLGRNLVTASETHASPLK